MNCPNEAARKKSKCPKCGQKILIPTPTPTNKTMLGKLEDIISPATPPLAVPVGTSPLLGVDVELVAKPVECYFARNGKQFGPFSWVQFRQLAASGQLYPSDMVRKNGMQNWVVAGNVPRLFPNTSSMPSQAATNICVPEKSVRPRRASGNPFGPSLDRHEAPLVSPQPRAQRHSGLGIASFLIAMLVGGLDLILIFIFGMRMASARGAFHEAKFDALAGGIISLYCVNCVSIPICLVGVGLGIVGLIAHTNHNHIFTRIGLFVNGMVILVVLALYALGSMGSMVR
jgi:hypothetical protein